MPNSYLGLAVAADFTAPLKITLDGEDFQFGDADTGYYSVIKALADRTMALHAYKGTLAGDNAWSGTNVWGGAGKVFAWSADLDRVDLFTTFNMEGGAVFNVNAGTELHIKSAGLVTTESGGIARAEVGAFWNVFGALTVKGGGLAQVESGGVSKILAGANLDIYGTATIKPAGTLALDSGELAFGAGTDVTGKATRTGPTKQSGNDAYRGERLISVASTSTTVHAERADVIFPTAVLVGDITWTLADPPDTTYQVRLRVMVPASMAGGHTLHITDVSGSFNIAITAGALAVGGWLDVIFSGPGVWFPCGIGGA